ncbi:MAG: hypothetical protein RL376_748, partial [Verrucomicrobiota bacterium]
CRVLRAVVGLVGAGWATRFPVSAVIPAGRFHESGRFAEEFVKRWF